MRKVKGIAAILMACVIVFTVPMTSATGSVDKTSKINTVTIPTILPQKPANYFDNITVNYTKIDTIYGPVNVPVETVKRLGVEKIISKYSKIKKQQEEYNKMAEQLELNQNFNNKNSTVIAPLKSSEKSSARLLYDYHYEERCWFETTSSVEPMLLYGRVYPGTTSNNGENFVCYLEREIYLNNYQDCIEIICEPHADGTTSVYAALFDNSFSSPVDASEFFLSLSNVVNPISYDVILDSTDNSYGVYFWDTGTSEEYYDIYIDDDNFSHYITHYYGSTELWDYSNYAQTFHTSCTIADFFTNVDGYVYYANTIFNKITNNEDYPFVYAYGYSSGYPTYSDLAAGNPDPS